MGFGYVELWEEETDRQHVGKRKERQIRKRWKESDRGVILQIYHPFVIDVLMLRQNAAGAPGSSVFPCSVSSALCCCRAIYNRVSVSRRGMVCSLRVLDFRSVQEGLRVERLSDC